MHSGNSLCSHHIFLFSSSHPSKQQARAEQEEEFISNTLFKKIQALQKEKETLAVNYEKEEEFLTNELSRKLMQVNALFDLPCPAHFLSLLLSFSWENGFIECFISQVLMLSSPRFCDLRMLGYGSCRLWSPPREGGMRRMRLLRAAPSRIVEMRGSAPAGRFLSSLQLSHRHLRRRRWVFCAHICGGEVRSCSSG